MSEQPLTNDEAITGLSSLLPPELGWTHTRTPANADRDAGADWTITFGRCACRVELHPCGQLDLIRSTPGVPDHVISPNAAPGDWTTSGDTCAPTRQLTIRDLREVAEILFQAYLPVRHGPTIPTNPRGTPR